MHTLSSAYVESGAFRISITDKFCIKHISKGLGVPFDIQCGCNKAGIMQK